MIVMPPVFNAGDTVYFYFDAYDANGASVTISGLAVTDIEVYKNGSTTQRSSDNGYALLDTDGIDFDGSTGLHGFSIDTSNNSDSGFWTDGAQYLVHVNAITVDSQTVRFSYLLTLGYLLRPTTAGRKLDVTATGAAGIDWGNVENQGTAVGLTLTTISAADNVGTVSIVDVIGTGAIAAGSFLAGAIDAAALAADAVTEIQSGLATASALSTVSTRVLLALPNAAPAGADGLPVLGANTVAAGMSITASAGDALALVSSSGNGLSATGATNGIYALSQGSGGGIKAECNGTGHGLLLDGAILGDDLRLAGSDAPTLGAAVLTAFGTGSALTALATQSSVNTIDDLVDDLETRLTTTRAGYLDNLSAGAVPTLAQILAGGDVDGYSLEQALKLLLAAMTGEVSGAATTTVVIRAADDSKVRITATVDEDGNRTALTLDATG